MFYVTKYFALLVLAGLSSCSVARHGTVSVPDTRVNWPQPPSVGRQTDSQIFLFRVDQRYAIFNDKPANQAVPARYRTGHERTPVGYPQPGLTSRLNDKMTQFGTPPVGGLGLRHQLADDLTGRPYKMPWLVRPLSGPQLNRTSQPVNGERTGLEPALETLNRLRAPGYTNPISPVFNLN